MVGRFRITSVTVGDSPRPILGTDPARVLLILQVPGGTTDVQIGESIVGLNGNQQISLLAPGSSLTVEANSWGNPAAGGLAARVNSGSATLQILEGFA